MNRTIVEVHVVQTVPPSNVNRDDTGSPKTAVFGGVTRARVSSQAWKRATRVGFQESLDREDLGVRTTRLVEQVSELITAMSPDNPEPDAVAEAIVGATGIKLEKKKRKKAGGIEEENVESKYLVFLSHQQLALLARTAVETYTDGGLAAVKAFKAKGLLRQANAVDIALFGRMVAEDTDLNVDASCQVAHALSVHAVDSEFDYFTAVDDVKREAEDEDAGASMIDTVEFNSSTLYRYANIDVNLLRANLGDDEATRRAISAFVGCFVMSMPTGKQNTFANRTLPELVLVTIRDTQPINLVGAFEDPVVRTAKSPYSYTAAVRLLEQLAEVTEVHGQKPVESWIIALGNARRGWKDSEGRLDATGAVPVWTTLPDLPTQVADSALSRILA